MFKYPFRYLNKTDLTFIACLFLLIICKFFLQKQTLLVVNDISEVHPLLIYIYAAAFINLFVFFITALFSNKEREEWWEQKNKNNMRTEILLNVWIKSLLGSFVIFLLGTIGAIFILGSVYMLLLFFIVFIVQRFFQLMFKKD